MKRFLSLVLSAALLLLTACTAPKEEKPQEDTDVITRVMALSGSTGFGMAGLMDQSTGGNSEQRYDFSVETDASNVLAALVNGSVDIAALPTNAAALAYQKTQGQVQLLALNTRGVLYLLGDGSVPVADMEDLKGQTVYVPAQNPAFIMQYLCEKNGLQVGSDVILEQRFAQPAELSTALGAGEVHLAVLPEPMVTLACAANPDLRVVLDLTEEWDKVAQPGSLVQGCVVVRREFAQKCPQQVETFLREYENSVSLLTEDPARAAQLIETAGIFAKAAVAEKAMPRLNVCFVTGEEMRRDMETYLKILYEIAPQSIGGAMPGEDFYYLP